MTFEPPNLCVSRPVAACARCRKLKVRCDQKLPACTTCERHGRAAECANDDDFARGKERSYPAFLETRIASLQRKLDTAKRKASVQGIPSLNSQLASSEALTANGLHAGNAGHQNGSNIDAKDVEGLVSSFGSLFVWPHPCAIARQSYLLTNRFAPKGHHSHCSRLSRIQTFDVRGSSNALVSI